LSLLNPATFEGSLKDAFDAAVREAAPIFVSSLIYADDRGWSLMNQLQGVMSPQGQMNFSMMYPGVIKAWHRHQEQTDMWIGLTGNLKVGVYCEKTQRKWLSFIGAKRPGVMIIPPPLWHGVATVGHEPGGLLYYVTHTYDPAHPDEERRAHDSVADFPWTVRHG